MHVSGGHDAAARHEGAAADGYLDVLHLQPEEFRRLVALQGATGSCDESMRWAERSNWSSRALAEFFGPTGAHSKAVVYPFDLSKIGVGFFHAVFLHNGTKVRLRLWVDEKESIVVDGIVRRCTFVSGRAHSVGVEFTGSLPSGILDEAAASAMPTLFDLRSDAPSRVTPITGAASATEASVEAPAGPNDASAVAALVKQLCDALEAVNELSASIRVALERRGTAPESSVDPTNETPRA